MASLTVAGGWLSHDVHAAGLLVALPLAVVALWRGMQIHGRWQILVLGTFGIGLMATSLFVAHGERFEIGVSVAGVIVLALAHFWNMRASRR